MQQQPPLTDEAQRVLREVMRRAMDGYSILSRTGLNQDALVKVLQELTTSSPPLVQVKGELSIDSVGETYVWVPPGAKGYARFAVGDFAL